MKRSFFGLLSASKPLRWVNVSLFFSFLFVTSSLFGQAAMPVGDAMSVSGTVSIEGITSENDTITISLPVVFQSWISVQDSANIDSLVNNWFSGNLATIDTLTISSIILPDDSSGAVIGTNALPFRSGYFDSLLASVFAGRSDFTIGAASYDATFNSDTLKGAPIWLGAFTAIGDGTIGSNTVGGNLSVKATEGTELVITNPDFASDLSGWTGGADWTWDATGKALHTAGTANTFYPTTPLVIVQGNNYKVVFTISSYSAGSITMTLGGVLGTVRGENGTFTSYVIAATTDNLIFSPTSTFAGMLDDISVKQITEGTLLVEGINTFSGRSILESGSAYAPAMVFSNDANKVGWFRYGATSMGYATGGATRHVFTPSTHWINSDAAVISMGTTLPDFWMRRIAAGSLALGNIDAAAPVAQTLSVQNVIAGTSNTAGVDFTISGSQGTGTGIGGSLVFKTAPAGGAGSTQNALATLATMNTTGLTLATGKNLLVGAIEWTMASQDSMDGEVIGANTIDDDALDFVDITLADFTDDVNYVLAADSSNDAADNYASRKALSDTAAVHWALIAALPATYQPLHASLTSISGLTEADVSILETTADNAYNVVTSGGNNYILGSNSGNTALEFKTPANVLSQISGQPLDADLTTLAGSTAWRVFYSDGSSVITELVLGADGTFLESNGASAAPAFRVLAAGDIPDISATYEVQLNNEAGLYGVLSDVTEFVETGDHANISLDHLDASDGDPDSALFVDASGNVGIGITSPTSKFHVDWGTAYFKAGSSTGNPNIDISRQSTSKYSNLKFSTAGTTDFYMGLMDNASDLFIGQNSDGSSPQMTILKTNGNVGIGTVDPDDKVSIGDVTPVLTLYDSDVNLNVSTSAQQQDSAAWVIDASQTNPQLKWRGADGAADMWEITGNTDDEFVVQNATNVNIGSAGLKMTGSLGLTGGRVTKGWFTDLESTNDITIGGTALAATYAPIASPLFTTQIAIGDAVINEAELEVIDDLSTTRTQLNYLSSSTGTTGTTNTNLVFSTSPTLVTPVLGVASGTSLALAGILSGVTTLTAEDLHVSSATPDINFYDTNATAGDINARIVVNATDTGDGTEDIDVYHYQQVAGAEKIIIFADADGVITVGDGTRVVRTNGDFRVYDSTPQVQWVDNNCGDGDVGLYMEAIATTVTSNQEDVDLHAYQQVDGVSTRFMYVDADGLLTLGTAAQGVVAASLAGAGFDVFASAAGELIEDPSDVKFKENIRDIENPLEMLMKLRGRHYNWRNGAPMLGSEYGLVAQEVAEVSEDLTGGEDYMSIKSRGVIAVLVEAVKAQQKEIEELKARLDN